MNIAILGAGIGQVPLILKAKSRGWKTIVVSPVGSYPGIKMADSLIEEDVRKVEAVIEKLRAYNVSAVLTDQLDSAVESVAYISEKLNLKGITTEVARKFKDKFYMLQCAQKLGIKVPSFTLTDNVSDAIHFAECIGYPIIMKPHDSSASKGVSRVDSPCELRERYECTKNFSSNQKVLIQQYIEKEVEYCVEAYTRNFKVQNIAIGKRDYFKSRTDFIPQATLLKSSQSTLEPCEKKILEMNKLLIEGLGLPFGITHGEYMVEEQSGEVYLVEIAARGGGVGISSILVPACTGVDLVDCLLDDISENNHELPFVKDDGVAAYFCFMLKDGIVSSIQGVDEIKQIPEVIGFVENVTIGASVTRGSNKYARKGPIHVKSKSTEECYQILDKIKGMLYVNMNGEKESNGVIWE